MFLPNASSPAVVPLFLNLAMHETVALPASRLLPITSSLLSLAPKQLSLSLLFFITIQLLAYFAPLIYKPRVLHRQQSEQQLSDINDVVIDLNDTLLEMRQKLDKLEESISRSSQVPIPIPIPWPSPTPTPALLQSKSDSGDQFCEFGSPPSLAEGDDLMLPPPAIGPIGGHAALGSFFRREVVFARLQRPEESGVECAVKEDC